VRRSEAKPSRAAVEAPYLRRAVALGALGAAGFALYGGQWPTAQVFGSTICRAGGARQRIALTYDDGPNPEQTPRLMEVLARHDAHATFFLIGKWAEREPGLVRELEAAGHAIGNHTYNHPRMPFISDATATDELRRCRQAVEGAGVRFSEVDGEMLMRPPYGSRRPGTLRTARAEGYVPVTWSVTCYDWRRTANRGKIARRAGRAIEGDVILLHDGSNEEPAADRSDSVAATEDTLRKLGGEGYEFVSIPELVGVPAS
jgi:peptidoglycan/xylan/chitin deacetylase (PgdA/CDA1 family)